MHAACVGRASSCYPGWPQNSTVVDRSTGMHAFDFQSSCNGQSTSNGLHRSALTLSHGRPAADHAVQSYVDGEFHLPIPAPMTNGPAISDVKVKPS